MDKKHDELNKHLNAALAWMGKIYVNDVFVDYMAMARQEIRNAIADLEKQSTAEENK